MNNINNPPVNPVDIYNRYLKVKAEEKNAFRENESNGCYAASGAGMCIRKHWYSNKDFPRKEKDNRSYRLLRLGTIMGQDFDAAIDWWRKWWKRQDTAYIDNDIKYYYEEQISNKDLNLMGHFDLLIVKDGKGYLYDYKTAHSYKFKLLFGRNPEKSPSNNYEYQLGTYGFMLDECDGYCDEVVYMSNIYIIKDNSVIKSKEAPIEFKQHAKEYWKNVNNYRETEIPKFGTWAPTYKWECKGYCDFLDSCDSPHKTKI